MIAILCSTIDPASMNIREHLLKHEDWQQTGKWHDHPIYTQYIDKTQVSLYTTDKNSVYLEHVDKEINAHLFIFATKHQSKSGIPSLSTHGPGNWSTAQLGGEDKTLAVWPAAVTSFFYQRMTSLATELPVEVVYEATHHGPAMEVPCCFIEIGSTDEQWSIPAYGKLLADVIIEGCKTFPDTASLQQASLPVGIGIGGLHTAPRFCSRMDKKEAIFGHICPHYALEHLDAQLITQAIERTLPKADHIFIDAKGLRSHKNHIMTQVETIKSTYPQISVVMLK